MSKKLKELQLSSSVATEEDIANLQRGLGERAETCHVHEFSEIRPTWWDDSETLATVLESKQQRPDAYETAYGLEAQALGSCATALGGCAEADAGGVAVGFNAKTCSAGGVAIGSGAKATDGSVVIGANACDDGGLSPIVIGDANSKNRLIVRNNGDLEVAGRSMATSRCVDELYKSYGNFTSNTNGEIAGLCSAVNTHETRLLTVCGCFTTVDQKFQAVDTCFTAVKNQAANLKAAVCSVEQSQEALGGEIDGLKTRASDNEDDVKALDTRVMELEKFVPTAPGVVDEALSDTSKNPVQNKIITAELAKKQDVLTAGENITIAEDGTISATGGGSGTVDSALSSESTNPVQNKVINAAILAETSRASSTENALLQGINSEKNTRAAADTALAEAIVELDGTKADALTRNATVNNVGALNPNDKNSMATADQMNGLSYQKASLGAMGFSGAAVKISSFTTFRRGMNTDNGGTNMWLRILRHNGTQWYVAYQAATYVTHNSYTENGQRITHTMTHKSGTLFIPTNEQVIFCYATSEDAPVDSFIGFGMKIVSVSPNMIASGQSSLPSVSATPGWAHGLAFDAVYEEKQRLSEVLEGKQDVLTAGSNITIENGVISATGGSGGSITVDNTIVSGGVNPVMGGAIYTALSKKQNTLTAGEGIAIKDNVVSLTGNLPNITLGNYSVVVGKSASINGDGGVVVGKSAVVTSDYGYDYVAIGSYAAANDDTPIVIGGQIKGGDAKFQIIVSKDGVMTIGGEEVAMKSDVRYSIVQAPFETGVLTLVDRAVNTAGTYAGEIVVNVPTKVAGKVRDFILDLTTSGELAMNFTGVTLLSRDGDDANLVPEVGRNIFMFTEVSEDVFLVSRTLVTAGGAE